MSALKTYVEPDGLVHAMLMMPETVRSPTLDHIVQKYHAIQLQHIFKSSASSTLGAVQFQLIQVDELNTRCTQITQESKYFPL